MVNSREVVLAVVVQEHEDFHLKPDSIDGVPSVVDWNTFSSFSQH